MLPFGGINISNSIRSTSLDSSGEYDFYTMFDKIQYFTRTADITLGTLETNLSYDASTYTNFNNPASFAATLKKIGFDVISTATTHSLNVGYSNLAETISALDEADILHTGTNLTSESQSIVVYKHIKGIKIGFISFSTLSNGKSLSSDSQFCLNLTDESIMLEQIELAKNADCELIIASVYWEDSSDDVATFLFQNGVDVVLGTNPNGIEKMQTREVFLEDGTIKNCFVIYSLGDFINENNMSIILNLAITRELDGSFSIADPTYTPVYLSSSPLEFLDVSTKISEYDVGAGSISDSMYSSFKSSLITINSLLGI